MISLLLIMNNPAQPELHIIGRQVFSSASDVPLAQSPQKQPLSSQELRLKVLRDGATTEPPFTSLPLSSNISMSKENVITQSPFELHFSSTLPGVSGSPERLRHSSPADMLKHSPNSDPTFHSPTIYQPTNGQFLFDFLRLRSKISSSAQLSPLPALHESDLLPDTFEEVVQTPRLLPPPVQDPVPVQLIDAYTLVLSADYRRPFQKHRYLASLTAISKLALAHALQCQESSITLVERDSLGGVDLIVDPDSSVIFVSLLSLPVELNMLINRFSSLSRRFKRILLVFEAHLPSESVVARTSSAPSFYAFSPAVIGAVQKLRRDLVIAKACEQMSDGCQIWYAFANDVSSAARYVRLFGDFAQKEDVTGGTLWDDRSWLVDGGDEVGSCPLYFLRRLLRSLQDEVYLANANTMNHFAAAVILTQTTLDIFIDELSLQDRLDHFGALIGITRVVRTFMSLAIS